MNEAQGNGQSLCPTNRRARELGNLLLWLILLKAKSSLTQAIRLPDRCGQCRADVAQPRQTGKLRSVPLIWQPPSRSPDRMSRRLALSVSSVTYIKVAAGAAERHLRVGGGCGGVPRTPSAVNFPSLPASRIRDRDVAARVHWQLISSSSISNVTPSLSNPPAPTPQPLHSNSI